MPSYDVTIRTPITLVTAPCHPAKPTGPWRYTIPEAPEFLNGFVHSPVATYTSEEAAREAGLEAIRVAALRALPESSVTIGDQSDDRFSGGGV